MDKEKKLRDQIAISLTRQDQEEAKLDDELRMSLKLRHNMVGALADLLQSIKEENRVIARIVLSRLAKLDFLDAQKCLDENV